MSCMCPRMRKYLSKATDIGVCGAYTTRSARSRSENEEVDEAGVDEECHEPAVEDFSWPASWADLPDSD